MFSIKNATLGDIPLIRELAMQVWPQTYIPIVGEEQVAYMLALFYSPEALQKHIEESGHSFIICYAEGVPAAFASYSEIAPHISKLHKLYILPGRQGKGIGRCMVEYIANDLKANNCVALRLNVNRYNQPAKAFYEKIGFRNFEEEDIDIGGGYFMNDYVLELVL